MPHWLLNSSLLSFPIHKPYFHMIWEYGQQVPWVTLFCLLDGTWRNSGFILLYVDYIWAQILWDHDGFNLTYWVIININHLPPVSICLLTVVASSWFPFNYLVTSLTIVRTFTKGSLLTCHWTLALPILHLATLWQHFLEVSFSLLSSSELDSFSLVSAWFLLCHFREVDLDLGGWDWLDLDLFLGDCNCTTFCVSIQAWVDLCVEWGSLGMMVDTRKTCLLQNIIVTYTTYMRHYTRTQHWSVLLENQS